MRVAMRRRAEAFRASHEFGVPATISEEVSADGTAVALQFHLRTEDSLLRLTDVVERMLGGHVETTGPHGPRHRSQAAVGFSGAS